MLFLFTPIGWTILEVAVLSAGPSAPYPFILLNAVRSGVAALWAPVIMMSQGRQADKGRSRRRKRTGRNGPSGGPHSNSDRAFRRLAAAAIRSFSDIADKSKSILKCG